jgi:hypothetical protein
MRKNKNTLLIYLVAIFMIVISFININIYLKQKTVKILGISTHGNETVFWKDFLEKNPNYIPGWIEIGRTDKAKKIDPNYF